MTTEVSTRSRGNAVLRFLARIPATLTLVGVLLVVGAATSALWSPLHRSPLWESLAYGLPALEQGRWWTPITGTFLVAHPAAYVVSILLFAGMAYLEFRRGSRVALGYFTVGQLFAVLASSLLLWLLAMTGWPWAVQEAGLLDVGPSGGTMACLAAAITLFAAPWRARGWMLLLAYVFVAVLFWGSLAAVEHALAVFLILVVDRSLRPQRASVREQRFVAFVALAAIAAIEIVTLLIPTRGPFGPTDPAGGSFLDVAIDVVIILLIGNALRRGRRWGFVLALILSSFNLVTGGLLVATIAVFGWAAAENGIGGDPSLSLATSTLWVAMLVYLIWVRRAFQARRKSRIGLPPAPEVEEVKDALRASGGGTLSWMTTWDGNSYARTSHGIVAYQRRLGVAIALADPLGPPETRRQSVTEFVAQAEAAGLVPCFFSADEDTRAQVPEGWRSLVVADDTIVDLPELAFSGKKWGPVRTALNRGGREEVTFRMTRLADEPWGVQQQLRAISEMWVGDKGLPEMGFTLGTLTEARDPEVRIALAVSKDGDVDGFLSWLPVYGGDGRVRGWTLDLMRRREGGFGPVMEFLIGSSAEHFRDEGAEIMSLSGAPLAHDYPPDAGMISELSDRLAESLEPVYGFQSLHRFKEKFNPRYETLSLLYRDESDLTRIAAGLTRAFLPDATLRQFAGAGIELVRGR